MCGRQRDRQLHLSSYQGGENNEYEALTWCILFTDLCLQCPNSPKCSVPIEKNGGCNHMQCYNCKHEFCWMCLGDWESHGSEFSECSRYKANPSIAHKSDEAREALNKYRHYFGRVRNRFHYMKKPCDAKGKTKSGRDRVVWGFCDKGSFPHTCARV